MSLFNCNIHKIEIKQNIYDICIIGTGLANYPILKELLSINSKLKVAVLEYGSLHDLKKYEYSPNSDFIRKDFEQMYLGFGGNSQKWANRLMLDNTFDGYFQNLLSNKSNLTKVLKYFGLKSIDFSINQHLGNDTFITNKAIWPKKVLRIQNDNDLIKKIINKFDLYLNYNAKYFTIENKTFKEVVSNNNLKIKSKNFILGCGGIENAKILLRSKYMNKVVFDGTNQIGKYLSDHPKKNIFKLKNFNNNLDYLLPKYNLKYKSQIGMNLNNKIILKEKIHKINFNINYKLNDKYEKTINQIIDKIKNKRNLYNLTNYKFLLENLYYHVPKENFFYYYFYFFQKIKKKSNHLDYYVDIFTEQPMSINNSIRLLNFNEDTFDITNNIHSNLNNSIDISCDYFKKFLNKYSIDFEYIDKNLSDASHILCTTKVSENDKNGVVDENCKMHSFDNIYITGSSCFPSVGYFNPTLFIMLQSLKTLDYILKNENCL